MRLLFSTPASPHHGFAAYYTYLESVFDADAVLHFGTHGSLEFMPGKPVGLSGECYPDRLAGTIPNLYYYAANNPSEATIAKHPRLRPPNDVTIIGDLSQDDNSPERAIDFSFNYNNTFHLPRIPPDNFTRF